MVARGLAALLLCVAALTLSEIRVEEAAPTDATVLFSAEGWASSAIEWLNGESSRGHARFSGLSAIKYEKNHPPV